MKLCEHPFLTYARTMRDGFTHRVRAPAELHGLYAITFESAREIRRGTDPLTHEAFALGLYGAMLREAAKLASLLFLERYAEHAVSEQEG
jgi:hypothetical protein